MAAAAAACTLEGLPEEEEVKKRPGEMEGRRPRLWLGEDAPRGWGGCSVDWASRASGQQALRGGGCAGQALSSSCHRSFASRRLDPSLLASGSFLFFLGIKQIQDRLIGGTFHTRRRRRQG